MESTDANKGKVETQLGGMLKEIESIRLGKIQRDMIGQNIANGASIDETLVNQLNGFYTNMTNGVKVEANKFLDRTYLTEEQRNALKGLSPEQLEKKREEFASQNPEYQAARKEVNDKLSQAISSGKEQLTTYLTDLQEKEAKVKNLLERACKDANLEHKQDKITTALSATLMGMDDKALDDSKLMERLTKDLKAAKTLSTKSLGSTTVTKKSLGKVSQSITAPEKKKRTMRSRFESFASNAKSFIGGGSKGHTKQNTRQSLG